MTLPSYNSKHDHGLKVLKSPLTTMMPLRPPNDFTKTTLQGYDREPQPRPSLRLCQAFTTLSTTTASTYTCKKT
ncbi:hypothetical protein Hamer_G012981 [Homarus americanus]|uniref:Uncharacterized protein n=1 Tax=Homarus americanus TaxID=6706 RepID=A0A8J5K5S1_HOMAM|nr:hypothetical protein Hamer_G012981 [Homarus americanus]